MSKEKKQNSLGNFLASRTGRKLFHMLYSFGAAVVIIGALAKIIHLPFGNELLIIGMVTEAFVFAISAFDTEQIDYSEDAAMGSGVAVIGGVGGSVSGEGSQIVGGGGTVSGGSGGVTVIGGGAIGGGQVAATGVVGGGAVAASSSYDPSKFSPEYVEQMDSAAKGVEEFNKAILSLNEVTQTMLQSYQTIADSTQGVTESGTSFSDNMKKFNDHVVKLNEVYEAQSSSIANQMNTINHINASLERIRSLYDNSVLDSNMFKMENERMTRQIQELNKVYARLLQAMNVGGGYNNNPMGGGYNPGGGGYNPGAGGYDPTL